MTTITVMTVLADIQFWVFKMLTTKDIKNFRAKAHHLNPVVQIGQHGLTEGVTNEIDVALKAHELIKIRIANDDKVERMEVAEEICERLGADMIQQIGKVVVVYREKD